MLDLRKKAWENAGPRFLDEKPTSDFGIAHQEILTSKAAETQNGRAVITGSHLRGSNVVDCEPFGKVHESRNGQMVCRTDSGHGVETTVESSHLSYHFPVQQKKQDARIQSPICHTRSTSLNFETRRTYQCKL